MKMLKHFLYDSPFGQGAFIFRESPFAIVEVLLPRSGVRKLRAALKRADWGRPGTHPHAKALVGAIADYFEGRVDPVFWPPWTWLDMSGLTPLQQAVLAATAAIPYGKVASYRQVAEAVDRPGAARFVGTTMARNPFPILIPCHRVVRSDGSIGQFGGGPDLKRKLLEREARLAAVQVNLTRLL